MPEQFSPEANDTNIVTREVVETDRGGPAVIFSANTEKGPEQLGAQLNWSEKPIYGFFMDSGRVVWSSDAQNHPELRVLLEKLGDERGTERENILARFQGTPVNKLKPQDIHVYLLPGSTGPSAEGRDLSSRITGLLSSSGISPTAPYKVDREGSDGKQYEIYNGEIGRFTPGIEKQKEFGQVAAQLYYGDGRKHVLAYDPKTDRVVNDVSDGEALGRLSLTWGVDYYLRGEEQKDGSIYVGDEDDARQLADVLVKNGVNEDVVISFSSSEKTNPRTIYKPIKDLLGEQAVV